MRRAHLLWAVALILSACGAGPRQTDGSVLRVFVGILPQKFVVERIGGSRVVVEALVQPGQDPQTYEPTPRQVSGLSEAKLYFRVGMGFEDALVDRMSQNGGPWLRWFDHHETPQLE